MGRNRDSREERWRGGAGLAHENRGEFSEGFYPAHHSPTKLVTVVEENEEKSKIFLGIGALDCRGGVKQSTGSGVTDGSASA